MNLLRTLAVSLLASSLAAQVDPQAREQADHLFDRAAGTPIQQAQKDKLGAWLQGQQGKDLGDCGYLPALQRYLERDYDAALSSLDAFFQQGYQVMNAEHRTMVGRVFLNGVAKEARADKPRMPELARWCEGMTRLYQDTAMLERMAKTIVARVPDPAAVRVALAKGVFAAELTVAQKDAFLQSLYQPAAAPAAGAAVALPGRPQPPTPAAGGDPSKVVQPGQVVEPFAIDRVVNGASTFDLTACKGKVVVLDFFASWCGPCRAALPALVQLQKDHPADLQVVGVTRYYGNGMDFSGEGATVPDGGALVKGLDHEQEGQLYESLVKAFGIGHPIVFSADAKLAAERFGVKGIPTLFVIGRDGKLVGSVVGGGEPQHETLRQLVEQARK